MKQELFSLKFLALLVKLSQLDKYHLVSFRKPCYCFLLYIVLYVFVVEIEKIHFQGLGNVRHCLETKDVIVVG